MKRSRGWAGAVQKALQGMRHSKKPVKSENPPPLHSIRLRQNHWELLLQGVAAIVGSVYRANPGTLGAQLNGKTL